MNFTRLIEEFKQSAPAVALRGHKLVGVVGLLQDLVLRHDMLVAAHACDIAAASIVLVGLVVDGHD